MIINIGKMSLKEIDEFIKTQKGSIDKNFLKQLQADKRVGAKKILECYQKAVIKEETENKKNKEMWLFEEELFYKNIFPLAGIDEAGRGPLAGPVFAAAVILPFNCNIKGIADSKKLSEFKRNQLSLEIKEKSISWGIGFCSAKVIDYYNIFEATKLAVLKALGALSCKPAHLLLDAFLVDYLPQKQSSLIKGDEKSISIAAASILAKVYRDSYMEEASNKYPFYMFAKNKGYPTSEHFKLLKKYGPCPEHRQTFITK